MFEVKQEYTEDIFPMLESWWDKHGFPPVYFLPDITHVCYIDNTPIYSVCGYETNSCLYWLAFPLSNKSIPYEQRKGGMEYLFMEVEKYAKEKGYKMMFTTSSSQRPTVVDALIHNDYNLGDTDVNHYVKLI